MSIVGAVRERIGSERFAVWFGDSMRITVEGGSTAPAGKARRVVVRVGTGFTHDWLRRTFHAEVAAAAATICGSDVRVAWEPVGADTPPVVAPPARPSGDASPAKAPPAPRRRPAPGVPTPSAEPPDALRHRPAVTAGTFVAGPSNRMALAAVERAATDPGGVSPLVIHGPSGVGKTHLLDVACARAREADPRIHVVSLSAEQFTTGFLQSLHGGGLPGFRRTCRGAGLLVVDDIQFLVGKRATLLEFQHTVDALHRAGRQMVFACDRELDALPGLGADLLTRLRGGMTAWIQPPDYDVRRGIVAAVCAARGLAVPDEVVHYVATHMTRHARELHGAVNRLEATSLMLGLPVTTGMAEEALADLVRSSSRSVRLADVDRAVCKAFGIEAGSLQSARRARHASHARMLAMFLARKHTHAALAEIGRHFGRRSHSTVIAAQKAVAGWLATRDAIVIADARWDADEAIRRVEDILRAG
ncbi:MAG: DnaA ATPase domain-containing protein [Planctomycetaceae bacterium]